jgi:hypothetical protein
VSQVAIRLVRAAHAASVKPDDIEDFVMARAADEGVAGWNLAALRTLVDPTEGIILERDGSRDTYVNGHHRAQAMLDTGVRHTVVVRNVEATPSPEQPHS